jgi:hypothetical protein
MPLRIAWGYKQTMHLCRYKHYQVPNEDLSPLLDRIDIEVPRVDYEKLSADRVRESSDKIRACPSCAGSSTKTLFKYQII